MSFRLRVLALVSLVAVTAVGATAWLVLRQASQQVTESVTADRQTVTAVVDELGQYARRHGTWEGVDKVVQAQSNRYGQRIKLVTELGEVVVDTDTLDGITARPVTSSPTLVDARPRLDLTDSALLAEKITLDELARYRTGIRLAACLTRNGLDVLMTPGPYGVARYAPAPDAKREDPGQVAECERVSLQNSQRREDLELVGACGKARAPAPTAAKACLVGVFAELTDPIAPVPLSVYLGAVGEPAAPSLAVGPVVLAAGLVALLAIAGTALLSRRVLRPIGTLTAASRRLGEGDLSLRVPAVGRDELAELGRSFNRMADSLQRGEERQKRMVADVAHELRTPLANLRGYLEALKDGVIPPSPELFASLHEEAVLQQRIVDDLQELALAEAGALQYQVMVVDLVELAETCRNAQQGAAEGAGVALMVEADGPVVVHADPDRLRQVLGNLIGNALRATPAGGDVTLAVCGPRDGQVAILVRDTGAGIAPADLPHVFDRFWRADAARGRTTGGSGLGLAIAKQIVTDHGGRIALASQVGVGTTVTITLPASVAV